jgi:hypothetical protein
LHGPARDGIQVSDGAFETHNAGQNQQKFAVFAPEGTQVVFHYLKALLVD